MARKRSFYRQCRLVKDVGRTECVQVSCIPDAFAKLGRTLKLRGDDKNWDDGWVVRVVGRTRLHADDLPDFHALSKAHLRATGDAETA